MADAYDIYLLGKGEILFLSYLPVPALSSALQRSYSSEEAAAPELLGLPVLREAAKSDPCRA